MIQNSRALFLKENTKDGRTQEIINLLIQSNYEVEHYEKTESAINSFKQKNDPYYYNIIICALGIQQDHSDFYQELLRVIRKSNQQVFILIFSSTASQNPKRRQQLFNEDQVNMVTECLQSLKEVASRINEISFKNGKYECPICGLKGLDEDGLWYHLPLYHVNSENTKATCPKCKKKALPNIQVHYRNLHGLCAKGVVHPEENVEVPLYAFALVVVRRKSDGKYLLVQEFANSGFWLPGGRVDAREKLTEAAIRECKEEAGVDIELKGILTIQLKNKDYARMRIIYYAEPIDENQLPKSVPCYESVGASYTSYQDIQNLQLRGNEPLEWIGYLENGGQVYPLAIFSKE